MEAPRLKGLEGFCRLGLAIEVERINSWAGLKTKEDLSGKCPDVEAFAVAVRGRA